MIRTLVKTTIDRLEPYIDKIDEIHFEFQGYLDYDEESKRLSFDFFKTDQCRDIQKIAFTVKINQDS